MSFSANYGNGWNWMVPQWGYVERPVPNGPLAVVRTSQSTIWFRYDSAHNTYVPRFGANYQLILNPGSHTIQLATPDGEVWDFHDFDQTTFPPGSFKGYRTAGGQYLNAVSYSGEVVTEMQRQNAGHVESFVYDYDAVSGLLQSITLRRQTDSGPWAEIRRSVYTYYSTGSSDGLPGDLQTAVHQEMSGGWRTLATYYYRYWIDGAGGIGFAHGLKYVVNPEAFRRLSAAHDPFTATDSLVAQFADNYFEYGADQRVTREIVGGGTRTTQFAFLTSIGPNGFNNWKRRTVETRPDGSKIVVFTNYIGQVLLRSLVSSDGTQHWNTYNRYDNNGRLIFEASAAAIASYSYDSSDSTSLTVVLKSSKGLINLTEYYSATDLGSGAVAGYVKAEKIKRGNHGTPVTLHEYQYTSVTAGSRSQYPTKQQTDYRVDDGSGAIVTHWDYSYYPGSTQIKERTITLPAIGTDQNGSGTSDVKRELFDRHGYLIATQDGRGFINTYEYNIVTGAMTREVKDDDPPAGSGWIANSGTRLKLATEYQTDNIGRTTRSMGPAHDISGTEIRTVQWTVYKDNDHETYSAPGVAIVASPGTFILINPVSITRMDPTGRTIDAIQAVRSSTVGPLKASDDFPRETWCRWTHYVYDDAGDLTATRVYHDIPASGNGNLSDNYDETTYDYDTRDLQNKVVTPAKTITRTVFDVRDHVIESYIGTNDAGATDDDPTGGGASGNNMKLITAYEYDGGADQGNGNLTKTTQYVDNGSSSQRVTKYSYDWRNRQTQISGEIDLYRVNTYDNLNRVIRVDRRNTNQSGNLIARSETSFDDLGRVYATTRYGVNPATGVVDNALVDNTWFNANGNIIKSLPSGSQVFSKTLYDGVSRVIGQYQGYYSPDGSSSSGSEEIEPYSEVGEITTDNVIFEQTIPTYDEAGNQIFSTQYQRLHNATGTGALNGPSGSQPQARVTYQAMWYDGIGRGVVSANYGTNDNSGAPTRPDIPPSSSDTVLVGSTTYSDRGEVYQTTDPAGMLTTNSYDDAGRITQTIQDNDHLSITTQMTYRPGGQLQTLTAINSDTGNQTTTYTYGVNLSNSALASNDLLHSVQYPDATDSTDNVSYRYNRQQENIRLTDQNGTVHQYQYDKLGRLMNDRVTSLGTLGVASIDGAVRRVGFTYEVRGMRETVTSYDNAVVGSGSIVNQVLYVYNDFGQLITEYQEHEGAVVL